MNENKPQLVIFAGPNGSGKSTITEGFSNKPGFPENYINPDEIAKTLNDVSESRKAYQAAIIAEEQRKTYITQKESFAFETVMSHPSKLYTMQEAKAEGYKVELVFIATSDPQINVDRVQQRVASGGHDVPADKIVERYNRTIELLPAAAEIADKVKIYDNTSTPERMAEIENGAVTYQAQDLPEWARSVIDKINERKQERIQIENSASQSGLQVIVADINSSKSIGIVQDTTNNFFTQRIDENTLFLHDRSITKKDIAPEQNVRVAYNDGNVAVNQQPTVENKQWAESILQIANQIFQNASADLRIETTSRGIDTVEGNSYKLLLNRNNQILSIIAKNGNREVASFDLEGGTVIEATPEPEDRRHWNVRRQPATNVEIQTNAPNEDKIEL